MTGPLRAQMQTPSGPNLPNARSPEDDISPLTFYESLQRDQKKDPSYRCPEPSKSQAFDMAQPYVEAESKTSAPLFTAPRPFIALVPTPGHFFVPLNLVVLFVWTLPIATLICYHQKSFPHTIEPSGLVYGLFSFLTRNSFIWQFATNAIPPESPTSIWTRQGKALVEEREKRLKHLKSIQQALAQDEHRALQDLKDVLLKNEEDEVRNIPTISQG
ncbi:uncharacterized protein EI90DRAFT_3130735 [Cantharellus anzutake]|uniref:uncharacterized protein n=1 Tax=Cantharellus anzutake TaxID=1750568 RepID=UPI00190866E4|nr:uncharacterized protein EI90DRAFT_3130735 [Cantharellus anzutake]KAF8322828.1 hypothetical protein EI90DRAFT_3130735 [Cantharellus anzutake]